MQLRTIVYNCIQFCAILCNSVQLFTGLLYDMYNDGFLVSFVYTAAITHGLFTLNYSKLFPCKMCSCVISHQVNGRAPIVNIDKTDGCQVFVQRATGLTTDFVTAKSSEVNVCLVEENGEYVSSPIKNGSCCFSRQNWKFGKSEFWTRARLKLLLVFIEIA